MKNLLSDADYALLLSCIEAIHSCRKSEEFPQHSVRELKKLVPCQMLCYAEIDYTRNRFHNVFDPPLGFEPPTEKWVKATHDHPVLNYLRTTGDGQALKISDFVTPAEYHQLDIYRDVYKHTGAEDQFGFGVQVEAKFVLGYAFDRSERTFTERDRMLLNLIRPHLIQAYLRLEELAGHEELQSDLQAALRENGLGVIVLNETCAVVHSTPGAFEKIANYIPMPDDAPKLPADLERWACSESNRAEDASLILSLESARLTLRRVRQKSRVLLLLSEESTAAAAENLAPFNLTPRELEVLNRIAEGKTNLEIATILGISLSTAKQHVERVLAKLGVENRTAAALMLRRVGF